MAFKTIAAIQSKIKESAINEWTKLTIEKFEVIVADQAKMTQLTAFTDSIMYDEFDPIATILTPKNIRIWERIF